MNTQTKHIGSLAIFIFIFFFSFSPIIANAQSDSIYVIFGNHDGSTFHWPFADTVTIPIWVSQIHNCGGAELQLYLNPEIIPQFIDVNFYFDWQFSYTFMYHRITMIFFPGPTPDSLNHIADINVISTDDPSYIGQLLYAFIPGNANFYDTTGSFLLPRRIITSQVYIDPPLGIEASDIIPSKPILNGNYPNPFNSSTAIRFYLPSEANAEITIYNIAGQSIKSFHLGQMSAGEKQVVWDGRDSNRQTVSSGMYFYSVKTDGFFQTSRMTLLK